VSRNGVSCVSFARVSFAKEPYIREDVLLQKKRHHTTCLASCGVEQRHETDDTLQEKKLQVSFAKEPYIRDDILLPKRRHHTTCLASCGVEQRHESDDTLQEKKLQVSFAKEPYIRDYILRKRPMSCDCRATTRAWCLVSGQTILCEETTGLFCKRALYKRLYSAKETYDLKE